MDDYTTGVIKSEDVDIQYAGEINSSYCEDSKVVTDDQKMKNCEETNDTNKGEEEKILSKLREVVRKCTHSDPTQRPTADALLKIIMD